MDFIEEHRLPPSLKKKKKKTMKKKKGNNKNKEEETPMELEVCKKLNIDLKDLVNNYFFPNNPVYNWDETNFLRSLKVLHHTTYMNDPQRVLAFRVRSTIDTTTGTTQASTKLIAKYFDFKTMLFPNYLNHYLVRRGYDHREIVKSDTLEGKYILICCFSVPQLWDTVAWTAVVTCSELYSKLDGRFEMVIVPKLRPGWKRNKDVFNQFFNAFPSSCLAVPFRSHWFRHYLCDIIGDHENGFLLVDPNGIILLHDEFTYSSPYDNLIRLVPLYGSDPTPFPFVSRKFVTQNGVTHPEYSSALWNLTTPSSLEGLLSSDFVFRMIHLGGDAFDPQYMPISHLKSKLVGLYLYSTGLMFPLLGQIMDQCRKSGKELEIVLVLIPTDTRFDPWDYLEVVSKALAKHSIPCWVAPFNRSASIVLEHLFEAEEKVIMVEPNAQYVEPHGVELMRIYGDCAYPFTLPSVVQKTVEQLRRLTLDSFFKLLEMPTQSRTSPSTGNMVYFYFDISFGTNAEVFCEFERLSKGDEDDAVLHYISLSETAECEKLTGTMKLKPENCHLRNLSSKRSREFLSAMFNSVFPTIVAFGPDGKIRSVLAHIHPSHCLPSSNVQVNENLSKEVWSKLESVLKRYDDDECNHVPELPWLEEIQQARQRLQGLI